MNNNINVNNMNMNNMNNINNMNINKQNYDELLNQWKNQTIIKPYSSIMQQNNFNKNTPYINYNDQQ
jgi:hypothetical protein